VLEDKRKFERFDLFVVTKIGQEGDTSRHSLGLTKNFSRDGISIEAKDFDFAPDNDLNLELSSPKGSAKIPLTGNVMWKEQAENTSIAGIRLKFQDEKVQNEILEEISYFGDIAKESLFLNVKTDVETRDETEEKSEAVMSTTEEEISSEQAPEKGFIKRYLENGGCEVTFRLPKEVALDAKNVALVGDFNDWNESSSPMTGLKDGSFEVTMILEPAKVYKFRYFIDGHRWENDSYADNYIANDYGWHDSVVMV
jgi:hypothetical protein